MNKLLGLICIIATLYIAAVFALPDSADSLAKKIGIEKVNYFLRGAKQTVDSTVNLPEASGGILDVYQQTVDNARDATNKAIEQGKQVKEKIDTVRSTLSGAEDTINKTIDTANTVIETGKEIQQKVGEVKEALDKVNSIGTNSGTATNN